MYVPINVPNPPNAHWNCYFKKTKNTQWALFVALRSPQALELVPARHGPRREGAGRLVGALDDGDRLLGVPGGPRAEAPDREGVI